MPVLVALGVTPFWCDAHRRDDATAIAGVQLARRVSVVAQIILASAVERDPLAKAEALVRLTRGVQSVGGILDLHTVNCQTGPWAVPPSPSNGNGKVGGE